MSMISTIAWVKRGVAKETPDKVELSKDDIKRMIEETREELKAQRLEDSNEDCDTEKAKEIEAKVDEELAEYNLDTYEEEDEGVQVESTSFQGLVYHEEDDGNYVTFPEDEDPEEKDDFMIKKSDCLVLTGQNEDEYCRMEVNVYEEHDDNTFIHHDVMLNAFPLCLEWLDFDPSTPEVKGNYVAIGSMGRNIDIWDLDVVDALEPVCQLGGKRNKKTKKPTGHISSVLGLSWNKVNRNVLASASADSTVKIWDMEAGKCVQTLKHHSDKVQSVQWHPVEPTVLLTGSYDRTIAVLDVRHPDAVSKWTVSADVECAMWNPHDPQYLLVSTEDGKVYCFNALENGAAPVFTIDAHDGAVAALSVSNFAPGCLVTGGTDKTMKVWDILNNTPKFICSKELKLGPIYDAKFCPDSPFVVAVGGGKGVLKVFDLCQIVDVRRHFEGRAQLSDIAQKKLSETEERDVEMDVEEEVQSE